MQFFKSESRTQYDRKFIDFMIANKILSQRLSDNSLSVLLDKKENEDSEKVLFKKKIEYLHLNDQYIKILLLNERYHIQKWRHSMKYYTTFGEQFIDLAERKIMRDKLERMIELRKDNNDLSLEELEERIKKEFSEKLEQELNAIKEWIRISHLEEGYIERASYETLRLYTKDKREFLKQIHPDTISFRTSSEQIQELMISTFWSI